MRGEVIHYESLMAISEHAIYKSCLFKLLPHFVHVFIVFARNLMLPGLAFLWLDLASLPELFHAIPSCLAVFCGHCAFILNSDLEDLVDLLAAFPAKLISRSSPLEINLAI